MNTIVINAIQVTAAIATGNEKALRWNGPRTNFLLYITRSAIGIPYEVYRPIVAIEVAAEKATVEPKLGRPRMNESVHASHTVHKG